MFNLGPGQGLGGGPSGVLGLGWARWIQSVFQSIKDFFFSVSTGSIDMTIDAQGVMEISEPVYGTVGMMLADHGSIDTTMQDAGTIDLSISYGAVDLTIET